jgi:hypothetical protein
MSVRDRARRRVAACAVLSVPLAIALPPGPAASEARAADDGEETWPSLPSARALVRTPAFDAAIEYLEDSPEEPDDPTSTRLVERRGEVMGDFARRVLDAGEALIRAAVEVVAASDDAEDRRRAQLLLAQHARLPAYATRRLEGSARFEAWAHAQLHRRPGDDYLLEPLHSDSWAGNYVNWPPPARELQAELADRVGFSSERLARCTEEYQDDYLHVAIPRLHRLAELVEHSPGADHDFDGDGDPEAVITCNFWEWDCETGWNDDLSFVALLDRASPQLPWRIAAFERLEDGEYVEDVLVRDFDRDGAAEAAIRTRYHGFWAGAIRILGLRTTSPLPRVFAAQTCGRCILLERSNEEPVRFVTSGYHVASPVGTWGEAVGVLASARECWVWNGTELAPAETIYAPMNR